jgi:hypothetical protein
VGINVSEESEEQLGRVNCWGSLHRRVESNGCLEQDLTQGSALLRSIFYRKIRLKAHGFNCGMKGGVAQRLLLGMEIETNLLYNRTYERCSSHWCGLIPVDVMV